MRKQITKNTIIYVHAVFLLVFIMLFCTACSEVPTTNADNPDTRNNIESTKTLESTAEPMEPSTPEPTEAPTPEPTEAPTPEPTEAPTPEPTEAPTPEPTEAPTPEPTEAPTPEPTEAPTTETSVAEFTYVLNTNSHKIHWPSCKSVKKIKPENYATTDKSVEELLNEGYTKCGNCL